MILKSFEIDKLNLKKNPFILLYGKNDGAKKEALTKLKQNNKIKKIITYEEKEIFENEDIFYNQVFSGSLFDDVKFILINRVSDKSLKIIDYVLSKEINDTIIIFNAGTLEKKSKIRNFFEKKTNLFILPFYEDNFETLSVVSNTFLKNNKIKISRSDLNLIISRCGGDRGILQNELNKIYLYSLNNKILNSEIIFQITNLIENHDIGELVDSYLSNNSKKIIKILNENNYTKEDCILISKTLLNKTKKILKLSTEYERNRNLDLTITNAKPPIFWKQKEITKQQLKIWRSYNLRNLLYKINDIELEIKKNLNNSLNLITDFLLDKDLVKFNN